jgi:ABC-2 type transport system ATP-binding protein
MTELREQGKSLFFSSHVLADVETLCDAVCILDRGVAVAQGRLADLLHSERLESEAWIAVPVGVAAALQQAIAVLPGVQVRAEAGELLRVLLPTAQVPALTHLVVQHGATLRELAPRRDTLEELFVRNAVHVAERGAA